MVLSHGCVLVGLEDPCGVVTWLCTSGTTRSIVLVDYKIHVVLSHGCVLVGLEDPCGVVTWLCTSRSTRSMWCCHMVVY